VKATGWPSRWAAEADAVAVGVGEEELPQAVVLVGDWAEPVDAVFVEVVV
jgi:hypothetical protein